MPLAEERNKAKSQGGVTVTCDAGTIPWVFIMQFKKSLIIELVLEPKGTYAHCSRA